MSHFTTMETQVRDVQALRAACTELGLAVEENAIARGYASNTHKGDLVIRLKGPYDIAVNKQQDGTYGMTCDWWDNRSFRVSRGIIHWPTRTHTRRRPVKRVDEAYPVKSVG